MPFDLSTAKPIQQDAAMPQTTPQGGGFDLSTAQPIGAAQPMAQPQMQPTKKSMGELVSEKMGQPSAEKPSFVQDWVLNLLDNPMGESFIRSVAPDDASAQQAIDYIQQRSTGFRKGVAETAATVGSAMVAEPVAGLAGLTTAPFVGAKRATETIEDVRKGMTYQPRTKEGATYIAGMGEAMQPIAEKFEAVEETLGEAGYEAGGPLLGAFGQALPTAVLSAAGLAGMRRASPASKLKLRIAQDLKASAAQPELSRTVKQISDGVNTGQINPNQLPAIIKGMEDDIVNLSGRQVFDDLARMADDAKAGDMTSVAKISEKADDIGRVQADKSLSNYIRSGAEGVKTDAAAKEAVKQGFDPGIVTAVKGSTSADKAKMLKMLDTMERGKKDARVFMEMRPADVAGNSLLDRVKYVRTINKDAAKNLDNVAKSLKGKTVDFTKPIQNFVDNLDDMGVMLDDSLKPVFQGSDIEGLKGPQAAIKNIIQRMTSGDPGKLPDAYELHRMKKYIDENVTYGKGGEGLKGKTQTVLKKLRHDLDEALDTQFPEYDAINTRYADTRQALDALQDVTGKKMNLSGGNADKALGYKLRGLMSNNASRVNLTDAVNELESMARKYGATFNDDIATQMLFADELDSVFGLVARTSLAGEVAKAERAVKQAGQVATGRGMFETAVDLAGEGIKKMRGVDQQKGFDVMRELLKRELEGVAK